MNLKIVQLKRNLAIRQMIDDDFEYISVSEYAEREGVSTQTIRNRITDGIIPTVVFRRGRMRGILCQVRKQQW